MRFLFVALLIHISCISFGQENSTKTIDKKEINTSIPKEYLQYSIGFRQVIPSLSYIHQMAVGDYHLMEINMDMDVRTQTLRNNTPLLQLKENKFMQANYPFSIPSIPKNDSNIKISGRSGYHSGFYTGNTNTNTIKGGIKNNTYRDASFYAIPYCPASR